MFAVGGANNGTEIDAGDLSGTGHHFSGLIDDFRIYNAALENEQIARLANQQEPFDPEDDARIRRYLRPDYNDSDPDDRAAFDRQTQQTSIEYFEQAIQSHLAENKPGLSLKDLPRQERIAWIPAPALPATLPQDLSDSVSTPVIPPMPPTNPTSDTPYVDVGELDDQRAAADLRFEEADQDLVLEALDILLPQVATRRLIFDNDSTSDSTQLMIDGEPLVSGNTLSSGQFHAAFKLPADTNWMRRPDIDVGAFMSIHLDMLAASRETVHALKSDLIDPSVTDVDDAFELNDIKQRESFLGRFSSLLEETWTDRAARAWMRKDQLVRLHSNYADKGRAFAFLWTYPAQFVQSENTDDKALLGFNPEWQIDAQIQHGFSLKKVDEATLADIHSSSLLFGLRVAG